MGSLPQDPILIHVIDDDVDVRSSIEWTLRSVGYVVQVHGNAADFLGKHSSQTPCCLIVDLLLPGMTGIKLCREIVSLRSRCAFVMLTGHGDVSIAVEAMKLGAIDFLEKPCSRQRLLDAVHRATVHLDHEVTEILEEDEASERLAQLTDREREVFDEMAGGRVSKEIATRLGISTKTVDVHRSRITQKLRFDSPTQLGNFLAIKARLDQRLARMQLNCH